MKIGIGITTRNRPELFAICMEYFTKYLPKCSMRFVVYDDGSETLETQIANRNATHKVRNAMYAHRSARMGVARAKNMVLADIRHCDHIFLFEDDAWPIADGWAEYIIDCAKANNCQALNACHPNGTADTHLVGQIVPEGRPGLALVEISQSNGYCMYWTNNALEKLGWYDERMGICGGEDTQINLRAWQGKLKPSAYCGPLAIGDYIYSVDLDWIWGKKRRLPTGMDKPPSCFSGSILTGEEKSQGWAKGAQFVHTSNVYVKREI